MFISLDTVEVSLPIQRFLVPHDTRSQLLRGTKSLMVLIDPCAAGEVDLKDNTVKILNKLILVGDSRILSQPWNDLL